MNHKADETLILTQETLSKLDHWGIVNICMPYDSGSNYLLSVCLWALLIPSQVKCMTRTKVQRHISRLIVYYFIYFTSSFFKMLILITITMRLLVSIMVVSQHKDVSFHNLSFCCILMFIQSHQENFVLTYEIKHKILMVNLHYFLLIIIISPVYKAKCL